MSCAECVVWAFLHVREAAYAFARAVFQEGFAPAGEYLVGICLMPDVEDELVRRGVVDVVHGDYGLDRPEAGAQMPGIA